MQKNGKVHWVIESEWETTDLRWFQVRDANGITEPGEGCDDISEELQLNYLLNTFCFLLE